MSGHGPVPSRIGRKIYGSSALDVFDLQPGDTPLVMSIPHVGEAIPPDLAAGMTEDALAVPDTDRYLDRLYDFAGQLGVTVLKARYSRYAIDLNRDPEDRPLYPGASNTELVPTTSFDDVPLYKGGLVPDAKEIARRRTIYWTPYHDRLTATLDRVRGRFGVAVLFDCHSIRSHVPRFFVGRLPDFNLGTGDGTSCDPDLTARLAAALAEDRRYALAVDGRFKGGYITRHYGNPGTGVHAFQLELAQATYAAEGPPCVFDETLAAEVRPALRRMLETAHDWAAERAGRNPSI